MGRKPVKKERDEDPVIREKWILALIPLFNKKGIHKISTDEISRYLGISKATLYNQFNSREEIFELCQRHVLDNLNISNLLKNEKIPFQQRFVLIFAQLMLYVRELSNILLEDIQNHYPQLWKNIMDYSQNLESELGIFFQKGIEKEEFRDISPSVTARNIIATTQEILQPEFLNKNNLTLKDALYELFRLVSRGIFIKEIQKNTSKEDFEKEIDKIFQQS